MHKRFFDEGSSFEFLASAPLSDSGNKNNVNGDNRGEVWLPEVGEGSLRSVTHVRFSSFLKLPLAFLLKAEQPVYVTPRGFLLLSVWHLVLSLSYDLCSFVLSRVKTIPLGCTNLLERCIDLKCSYTFSVLFSLTLLQMNQIFN